MKHFYHHIVEIEPIYIALSGLDLDQHEKDHLITIIETNIHHSIIDTLLSELTHDDKKVFLVLIAHEVPDHSQIWKFLNTKVDEAEAKIKNTVEALVTKLHADIQETHAKK